ncbi:hypothetical protein FRB96_003826 [Tulasnella sp. 330]|nr:hypothetical protein FRB96_003826 [Tulasnella sp. 330]
MRYWAIVGGPWVLWVFIGDHSQATCNKLWRSPQILAMWNQIWAECVLVIRVYAFWGNSKSLLALMCGLMVAMVTYQIWTTIHGMALLPFIDPPTGPCFPTVTYLGSPLILIFFLLPMIFDSFLTILTLVRMVQLRKHTAGHVGSPLMKTFIREGLYYFILIAAANLVNAIFYFQPKQSMSALNVPLSVYFPDILAARLILDLREKGKAGGNSTNHITSYSHSHRRIAPKVGGPTGIVGVSGTTHQRKSQGNNVDAHGLSSQGGITALEFDHELATLEETGTNTVRRVTIVTPNGCDETDVSSDQDLEAKLNPYQSGLTTQHEDGSRGIRVHIESHHFYEPSEENKSEREKSFLR